jgi:two-component system, sensor histidine kinase and response regulator
MTQPDEALILIVDDEPANVMLLERLLGKHFRVCGVTGGQQALDMLAQAPFDLVLLDIMMPGMTGLDVLQCIRTHGATAELPVVLISALANSSDITRGLELGANDYITKPVDIDVTLARVRTQLRLKRLEDERKNAIRQLENAQEMQERLLKIASHDLKGPIMNIGMIARLLRDSADVIPDAPELLAALDGSLDTMNMVIKDFLDTAVLRVDGLQLKMSEVDLAYLTTNLLKQFGVHAARKNIALNVEYVAGVIYADKSRFEQALGNLVSNAIKYSPADTTVQVWTERADEKLRICVADQGPGIPEAERGKLFTQFGKLSTRPTAGENSTGLGLWIVKHLINLQGGEVGVHNPPEGGSIFYIEMPMAAELVPAR